MTSEGGPEQVVEETKGWREAFWLGFERGGWELDRGLAGGCDGKWEWAKKGEIGVLLSVGEDGLGSWSCEGAGCKGEEGDGWEG